MRGLWKRDQARGAEPARLSTWDRIRLVLAAFTVLGIGTVSTLAAWTDTSTATSGTFSTGTIDLKIGTTAANAVDTNPTQFTTSFTLTDMAPGATTTAALVVVNSGGLPFNYTIAGTATNNGAGTDQLGSAMTVQLYAGSACSGTVLNTTARFTFPPTTARNLAAGANETLCVRAALPGDANTALQNKTTVGTFTFTATNV